MKIKLTKREKQILELLAEGYTCVEISKKIHLSPETIKSHTAKLKQKLQARNAANLIKNAFEKGFLKI